MNQITIVGKQYKVASNFIALKKFAKIKGVTKVNEVAAVLDGFSKINDKELTFDQIDDISNFMLCCIEAGEGQSVDLTADDLQLAFMKEGNENVLKDFFEVLGESMGSEKVVGNDQPNRVQRRKAAKS